ncbi:MAG: hypothetical protein JWO62_1784 [Acidimicrobiaceae bacterium]|nr:hypothetical protein [Acidimicrobiaceae bacterium]
MTALVDVLWMSLVTIVAGLVVLAAFASIRTSRRTVRHAHLRSLLGTPAEADEESGSRRSETSVGAPA